MSLGCISKINSNMRCIEIVLVGKIADATGKINSNMRCIEIADINHHMFFQQ